MKISSEALRARIHYDPGTGVFSRIGKPLANASIGKDASGYVRFMVATVSARGHEWAWFYMTGEWPCFEIDHKNGVRDDNRWSNLRAASRTFNRQNQRKPSINNTTGYLGVHRLPSGRFRAAICVHSRIQYLGVFDSAAVAHEAYLEAKRRLHPGNTL